MPRIRPCASSARRARWRCWREWLVRDQMLAPVLDPFHRPAQPHRRDQHQNVFRIEFAAHPEAAANVQFVQVQRVRIAVEHPAKRVAIAVGDLGRAVQPQHVEPGVVGCRSHRGFPSARRNAGRHRGRVRRRCGPARRRARCRQSCGAARSLRWSAHRRMRPEYRDADSRTGRVSISIATRSAASSAT